MAISEKQAIYNQLDLLDAALSYVNKEHSKFSQAERSEAEILLEKIDLRFKELRGKVAILQKDLDVPTSDLLGVFKRIAKTRITFADVKLKLDPAKVTPQNILRSWSKPSPTKPDLPPPPSFRLDEALKACKRYQKLINEDFDLTSKFIQGYDDLLDRLEDSPIEAFIQTISYYLLVKEYRSNRMFDTATLEELMHTIENELQDLIVEQAKLEVSDAELPQTVSSTFLGPITNSSDMAKGLVEAIRFTPRFKGSYRSLPELIEFINDF